MFKKMWVILGFVTTFFSPALADAQHRVVLDGELQHRLGLPRSEYYVVYTREEYGQLKQYDRLQQQLIDKLKLEIDFQQQTIADLKLSQQLLQHNVVYWKDYAKLMFSTWEKCDLRMRKAEAGSWWPWVVTAAALTGTLIASGFAVYYHHELRR